MKKRKLGRLEVSSIGLGCMSMSEFYGEADESEAISAVYQALDSGVNFFDTADIYGMGENEKLLGKALKNRRSEAIVSTKFGVVRDRHGNTVGLNGRPEYVKKCIEDSLLRLEMEYVDLYYQHIPDPDVPIEETVGAMADLVKEGKVRFLGLSNAGADLLARASKVHQITALQSEYSLWNRDIEAVLPVARELGIGIVAHSPLGNGFLTGKLKQYKDFADDDIRRRFTRFQEETFNRNLQLVAELERIAKNHKAAPSQIALAWVLAQGSDIVPIPGTKRKKYLIENSGAANITFTQKDLERINRAANPFFVKSEL
ncbi:aldo/keto reductase [Bacillus sonorensis]|uniref:Pyridoxine 4-dehydrogenase n=2 Tax=Bacillus sonorensis TaxID=119858 RepID=M5P8L1_9BACI|nr:MULTISPECIES: aldo/keto reductase [Bacillus]TWK82397.1 General stress protein 69 [Bacillus paralicheniformis]EME76331.1 Pyridoxine 4-dehydrogenase [Bacillus sonorensis L12]MCZ0072173.1 aldo/keto reductase [Bacillus sonorensis]MCZ0090793.1 aldo/keto reductase [Bacillus sonorensis]MDR4958558.1 aldo/keto reductase [Bacillus sonorensis]